MSDSPNSTRRSSVVPSNENQFSIGEDEEEFGARASAGQGGLRLPLPARPELHTINSSTGLLSGDANTPGTPYSDDPFNRNSGILDNGSLAPNSEPSSPVTGTTQLSEPAGPPKIHLNSGSIPNTPERPSSSTFDAPPSFSSPFASAHDVPTGAQLTNRRRSSIAPSGYGATDDEDGKKGHRMSTSASPARLATITAALSSGVTSGVTSGATSKANSNIINRRSQRAKANRLSKKDRDSKDYKGTGGGLKRAPFQSTRLKGEIYKPWLEKRDPAMRWARWITIASIIIGVALAAFLCYNGYAAVPNLGKVCEVLNDDFNTLNTDVWQREVRLDGYGHGSFQWTTNDDKNSFVDNGILYLVPTLTSDVIGEDSISNGYTLNLTTDGTCTSTNVSQCVAVSNSSRLTVINPVRSARLITKNTVTLNYGKVEVKAKFPTGDWLWPSISLLPVNNTYGEWPRSGQIDILTGRGNNASYPNRGVDYAQSSLHWGPTVDLDRLWMTWGYREQRRTYYNQQWHTYGLEWNDKYMWTYIDSKVSQVISLRFNKQSFWERGKFPSTITNSTTGDVIKLINPWLSSEKNNAPFDQPFYLVLDLSVGATDGWFPDGEGGKPWLDNSGTSMSDFWLSKDKWWNNWSSDPKVRGFAIDSVKMWKTC